MSEAACIEAQQRGAGGVSATADPGGVPFAELTPERLRQRRTSIKWTRFPDDVLPLYVAEMDYELAPAIKRALIERVEASDTGYLDGPGPLAAAFAGFAEDRFAWAVPEHRVHLATDVATGVVEALRVARPNGGRLALATPCYPGFFEMLEEVPFETVQLPLISADGSDFRLDLAGIAAAFATEPGIDAFILCNPHNPHGTVHSEEELAELARLAARHDVFVVSDEIHAPLTHPGTTFTPFAPLAAAAGALSVTTTSASKGWNLAGAKCSVIVAADDRADALLRGLPPETTTRASILGLHAGVAAFAESRDWLDRAIALVRANEARLHELVAERLPGVRLIRPRAGYLAWLDFTGSGLGPGPAGRILAEARVALNDGAAFGVGGAGHARINLACAPDTLERAIDRIAGILPGSGAEA
ncbi:aminotransferase class I/II-fold pyridoxal phosphate-dependent enzyme [Leucobacter sp. CSA2]|uniref:cysteine-S-conjugate beta-lyase n=1 Tax=Leucobacter edaphi TaxID=2796472 RepID=A0A934QCV1_9MICO|nr:aminotransferase class I/II-fold pyridoxal phosphate-dependent enzyme [Leucobacter edaphi]MBK0422279.1 aminotransferase class I/II-fold pyridoxal phosphate-dependent enzyme [Leucobacter edaphi]